MESNTAPLLEMRGIKKDFFGNQVLTDINFTLKAGEVLGLAGENGAGKSTLMKILFGMDVIRETGGYGGDVLINGEKVTFNTPFDALEAGIGMVHQEFSLIPGFTATENILLNREPQKKTILSEVFGDRLNTLDYKEMDKRAEAAIEKMGVHIDADMRISDMPVGHKQFTEIARELSKDQLKLLILDEPTAGLDPRERVRFRNLIHTLAEDRIVILSTHIVSDIETIAGQIVMFKDHRLYCCDSPARICARFQGRVFQLPAGTPLAPGQFLLSEGQGADGPVLRVLCETPPVNGTPVTPGLEDAFLAIYREEQT